MSVAKQYKPEADKLLVRAGEFPKHSTYIRYVAICRPIETIRAVSSWLDSLKKKCENK